MLELEEHFSFNDLMEIHALNLKRLPAEGEGKLLDWLRFLKAETEEEFKMLAEKNPLINEAYCKLQAMSEDEANRMIYEALLKAQRDEYSRIQGALKQGLEQGRQERDKEVARNLKRLGISVEQIVQATGLSPDAIAAL
jgi:predicted transposase/invertase (TIGR01784 family)